VLQLPDYKGSGGESGIRTALISYRLVQDGDSREPSKHGHRITISFVSYFPNFTSITCPSRLFGTDGTDASIFGQTEISCGKLFQDERDQTAGCQFNGTPEDITHFDEDGSEIPNDVTKFAIFMRFLDQPQPVAATASTQRGLQIFHGIGCALCHMITVPLPPV